MLAYSDLSHEDVVHNASITLASGAGFTLLGPNATMPKSETSVVAVGADGRRVALVVHPMPYGDLEARRVQRFASRADIDALNPTIEEREEYERAVELGMILYAGVDYGRPWTKRSRTPT